MTNRSSAIPWDAIGFSASTLCAIHCAATPLLLTALTLAGLGFLAHPAIEAAMIGLSLFIGATSLLHGYSPLQVKSVQKKQRFFREVAFRPVFIRVLCNFWKSPTF
jgi:hypothetical protein